MGARERNREATRGRILATCEELFRRQGFEATSIDDIISGADVSRQTFFNHLPSKQLAATELWLEWLGAQGAVPPADPDPSPPGGVLAAMRRAVLAQAASIEADRDYLLLLFSHASGFPRPSHQPTDRLQARTMERTAAIFDGVAGVIRAGQRAGEIRAGVDARQAAEIYVSAMLMTIRLWLAGDWPEGETLGQRMVGAVDLLEAGLRAEPGDRP